ncbi:MAG: outer membrane beta-barrel protein [Brumimicrobium sp.]|nr:outer membrane beta-barrel protein [Brumimicrobium sp.]
MKKKVLLFAGMLSFLFTTSGNLTAQVEQGSIIIDPYYGFPNFGKSFLQAVEDSNPESTDFKSGGIGPAGLRAEYMVSDRIGLGFDIIYNSLYSSFTDVDTTGVDGSGNYITQTYEYEYRMQRLRAQVRINYHFDISNPQFDSYIGLGAGTNNRFRTTTENGVEVDGDLSDFTLIPFSMRFCAGARYYFTDNIGLNMEIGLGGPVLSGGISFKF